MTAKQRVGNQVRSKLMALRGERQKQRQDLVGRVQRLSGLQVQIDTLNQQIIEIDAELAEIEGRLKDG